MDIFRSLFRLIVVLTLWSSLLTEVKAQACENPPHIGNGYIVSASPYNDGDIVVYTCQESYNMEGKADAVSCSSGKWVGELPVCTTTESKTLSVQMWVLIAIGIALGILLLAGLILLCVYCCCKRESAYVGPGGIFGTYNTRTRSKTPVQVIQPQKPKKVTKKAPFTRNTTVFSVDDVLMRNEVISRAVEKVKEKAKNKTEQTSASSIDKTKKAEAFFIPADNDKKHRAWQSQSVTPRSGMHGNTRNSKSPDSDAGYSSKINSPANTPRKVITSPETPPYIRGETSITIQEFMNRRKNPPPPTKPPWLPHTHGVRNINTITK